MTIISKFNMHTFIKVGSVAICFLTAAEIYMKKEMEEKLAKESCYENSLRLLRNHKHSLELLGQPVKFTRPELQNEYTKYDAYKMQLAIPVNGSKNSGHLFVSAQRDNSDSLWTVCNVELGLTKQTEHTSIYSSEQNSDAKVQQTNKKDGSCQLESNSDVKPKLS